MELPSSLIPETYVIYSKDLISQDPIRINQNKSKLQNNQLIIYFKIMV